MKKTIPVFRILAVLITFVIFGVGFTNEASAQGVFQKRKYRKGFYVDFSKNKQKNAQIDAVQPAEVADINVVVEPSVVVEEQAYELPFQANELAYENVEFAEAAELETPQNKVSAKIKHTLGQLGLNEKQKGENGIASQVDKWKKLKTQLDPNHTAEQSALDPLLKKSIIFAVAAVVVSIFSSIIGWFAFGWFLSFIFWMVAVALWIVALYFFIMWLMEQ